MNCNDIYLIDCFDDVFVVDSEFLSGINFYENIYKLLLDVKMLMLIKIVEIIIVDVLKECFKNEDYDSFKCKDYS